MADADKWKQLQAKIKAKKACNGKGQGKPQRQLKGEEITIQRLSGEVSGKAQKYSRIGPRQFVPFDTANEDLTIDNIKRACETHFSTSIGKNMVCDVLAGEQGPSCRSIEQIPDLKVIHIRFVTRGFPEVCEATSTAADSLIYSKPYHSFVRSATADLSSRPAKVTKREVSSASSPSKYFPRSLSVADMMDLGKLNNQTASTVVNLLHFDMEVLSWSKVPRIVEFCEENKPFGEGGFRKAYKATSKHPEFMGKTWVIKRYLSEANDAIEKTGLTIENHTRKVVQMHLLAKNLAAQLKEKLEKEGAVLFGGIPRYRKIFYGVTDEGEHVTVEEFIKGQFSKYINNTGIPCVDENNINGQKAQCFTHFTYEKSRKALMVVDIQGSDLDLYDPEIASTQLLDDNKQLLYCTGNLSESAIKNFTEHHKCNRYCNMARLTPLKHS